METCPIENGKDVRCHRCFERREIESDLIRSECGIATARTLRSTKALTNWQAIASQSTRAPGRTRGCGYFSWVQPMPPMPSKKERFSKLFSDELSGTTESKVLVRLQRELQQHQKHVETCCERASFVADLSGIMFPIGS